MPNVRLIFSGILSILCLFISGGALATNQEEDQLELTKVCSKEELAPFKDLGRIEIYYEAISPPFTFTIYDCKERVFDQFIVEPEINNTETDIAELNFFGVYKLIKGSEVVGIQSIMPHRNNNALYAEVATDIIKAKQGQGFGTILRKKTAKLFDQYIGSSFSIKYIRTTSFDPKKPPKQKKFPIQSLTLSRLYSDNEWLWGKNGASLKSSLNAGYGIVCISTYDLMRLGYPTGLVQMTYPRTEHHWSDKRVEWLMQFSRLNASDLNQESLSFLVEILKDLDYSQDTELSTFYAIITFIKRKFKKDETLMDFIDNMSKYKINHHGLRTIKL